ncbi:MAG: uracil-DNA glycosylase [Gemmatimonadota bacterium]|nr:uracil-DNA glycosylase [Gemmatimonadota bacterium]MDH3424006.1 uracil-DNA glycosylase [Gemmatimonadota bacterium]
MTHDSRDSARDGARLLRQRMEMGEHELFLDGLTREQALSLAAAARKGATRAAVQVSPTPFAASVPAAPATAAKLAVLPASYEELRDTALVCTRCRLSETRTQVVFSDGAVNARLVVVGEAPGANEDASGLPFVGAAGKYLDLLLASVGLSREDSVYICNVLKCRPPANRNPMADEIDACAPFLKRQLELIRPMALLAVGSFAAQLLTGSEKTALGKLRGQVHSYEGVPLVCTYHPAALLRNPKWTRSFWDDLQLLRTLLDGA